MHMNELVKKANRMISGLKIIRPKLSEQQFLQVTTSQYFGKLNYGIAVWYDSLLKKDKRKLDTLHYRALRVAVRDWRRELPRDMLDTLGRARPLTFANYSLGSIIINAYSTGIPERLGTFIRKNQYTRRRSSEILFYDSSRKKVGRQSIKNRMMSIMNTMDQKWTTLQGKNNIRRFLKKTFFK